MTGITRVPGPPQRILTGSLTEFRRDILGFLTRCAREYGDISYFRLGHVKCLLVNRPDLIEQVLVKNSRNYRKHYAVRFARPVLGLGLLTNEGDQWRRQRRLAAPAFHADRVAEFGAVAVVEAHKLLESWQDGQIRDMHADMMRLALNVVSSSLFGARIDETDKVDRALASALIDFAKQSSSTIPLPKWLPTAANRRLRSTVRDLNDVVQRIIDQRRRNTEQRRDLLSVLLEARDDQDGAGMSDSQLLDEIRTLLLAGYETTALTLAWTLYLLARHPGAQTRLHAELAPVLADHDPCAAISSKLTYARQVIMEAMRLYPPSFVIGRESLEDCELAGYDVPAKTTLFMSQWVMHRDARYYERPEQFEPERWKRESSEELPNMAYFPFGAGPRICIGNNFAMMETILLTATIARDWSFRLANPNQVIEPSPLFTLRPRSPIEVVLSKRSRRNPASLRASRRHPTAPRPDP